MDRVARYDGLEVLNLLAVGNVFDGHNRRFGSWMLVAKERSAPGSGELPRKICSGLPRWGEIREGAVKHPGQVVLNAAGGAEENFEFLHERNSLTLRLNMARKEERAGIGIPGENMSVGAETHELVSHECGQESGLLLLWDIRGDACGDDECVFKMPNLERDFLFEEEVGFALLAHGEGGGISAELGSEVGDEILGLIECHSGLGF